MIRHTFTDNAGARWDRVDVRRARNAFMDGAPVVTCPCKLRPFGYWRPEFRLVRDDSAHAWEIAHYGAAAVWEELTNSITAYNCSYESGYYLAYYIQL